MVSKLLIAAVLFGHTIIAVPVNNGGVEVIAASERRDIDSFYHGDLATRDEISAEGFVTREVLEERNSDEDKKKNKKKCDDEINKWDNDRKGKDDKKKKDWDNDYKKKNGWDGKKWSNKKDENDKKEKKYKEDKEKYDKKCDDEYKKDKDNKWNLLKILYPW